MPQMLNFSNLHCVLPSLTKQTGDRQTLFWDANGNLSQIVNENTGECVAESQRMGVHERTVRRWIGQWTEDGKLYKPSRGVYQKVA